jgi:peptidyl-tRNA hydrolase
LGTKDFVRFRIGIRTANNKTASNKAKSNRENFVLQKFNKGEEKILKEVVKKTCLAIEVAISEGVEKTMSKVNK